MAKKTAVLDGPQASESPAVNQNEKIPEKTAEIQENNPVGPGTKVTKVELGLGSHLLGNSLTLASVRGSTLELSQFGILATSKTGRVVLLPWANTRCVEIEPSKVTRVKRTF